MCFLTGDRKGMGLDVGKGEEELSQVEGRETVSKTHCVCVGGSIFNRSPMSHKIIFQVAVSSSSK